MSEIDRSHERDLLIEAAITEGAAAGENLDAAREARAEAARPFMRMLPSGQLQFGIDGNQCYVLLGENIQDGVAGVGDSMDAASRDFDRMWMAKLPRKKDTR